MYDFAKRPLWIVSHVLVILGVLLMIRLGLWQMSRWQDETDTRDTIEAGLETDPVPLGELVGDATPLGAPATGAGSVDVDDSVRYTRVVATGTWDTENEVVIRNRSQQGRPGGWLLTPLVQPDGTAVAVVRGWVPLEVANAGRPYDEASPPEGGATVIGIVGLDQPGGGLGPQDAAEGELESLARVDLERLAQQLEDPLEPVWLTLQGSDPPQDDPRSSDDVVLQPVDLELPSPSQNFSYMMQWFLFATIAAVGYLLILRKVARGRAGLSPDTVAPPRDEAEIVDV